MAGFLYHLPLLLTLIYHLYTFRYDDTNPEAEKKEYIDHIEEIVEWMGWKPFKVISLICFSFYFLSISG
jgi:hypothetical protein